MGLDCVPLGRAKAGQEAEWQTIMAELYAGKEIPDETMVIGEKSLLPDVTAVTL